MTPHFMRASHNQYGVNDARKSQVHAIPRPALHLRCKGSQEVAVVMVVAVEGE